MPGRVRKTVKENQCIVLLNGKEKNANKGETCGNNEVTRKNERRQGTLLVVLVTLEIKYDKR